MGTILKTKFCLSNSASIELGSVKKSRTPFIIQLPTDSPGWTLAVIMTPLRFEMFSALTLLVIVKNSHLLPASVSQRTFLEQNCAFI
jgi:hypothetical protein